MNMDAYYLRGFNIVDDEDGTVSVSFTTFGNLTIFALDFQGVLNEKGWLNDMKQPNQNYTYSIQTSECDIYGLCGSYATCNPYSLPICNCLRGFEPSNRSEWNMKNWTNGCVRKTSLQCDNLKNGSSQGMEDDFFKLEMIKVPDFAERSSALDEQTCRSQCLENCTCVAYSYSYEIRCMFWRGNLIDIQHLPTMGTGGLDLHVRLASSDFGM